MRLHCGGALSGRRRRGPIVLLAGEMTMATAAAIVACSRQTTRLQTEDKVGTFIRTMLETWALRLPVRTQASASCRSSIWRSSPYSR